MIKCIDCVKAISSLLSNTGVSLPGKQEVSIGYQFQFKGRVYKVKKIQDNRAFATYTNCSCSGKWFKISELE